MAPKAPSPKGGGDTARGLSSPGQRTKRTSTAGTTARSNSPRVSAAASSLAPSTDTPKKEVPTGGKGGAAAGAEEGSKAKSADYKAVTTGATATVEFMEDRGIPGPSDAEMARRGELRRSGDAWSAYK